MKQDKQVDREFRPLPKLANITELELSNLECHIVRRARAWGEIDTFRKHQSDQAKVKSSLHPFDKLKITADLFDAGVISQKDYFFFRCHHAESVDNERQGAGLYDSAFAEVNAKMRDIEKSHGLSDDQYWLKCDAPSDWLALADQYDKIAAEKFEQVLADLDFLDLLELFKGDKKEYDRMREAGRRSQFESDDSELAIIGLILDYERQAERSANGKAYFAAGTMLCAAMEARLLHRIVIHFEEAKTAALTIRTSASSSRKIHSDPMRWSFDDLLQVSHVAGWIDTIETQNAHCSLYGWLNAQRYLRNYIHPGNNTRKNPHILPEKEAYEDALQAYNGLRLALGKLDKNKAE